MARTTHKLDQPRYARWVRASKGVRSIEPALIPFVEGLGRIEARLRFEDARYLALPRQQPLELEEFFDLMERVTLSRLWVLGAYEVARTLSQRVRDTPALASARMRDRIRRTKTYLERIRIPLAKFEPSRRHAATDYSDPPFTIHREHGVAWKVASRTIVPRQKVADRLLKLCVALKGK
jgi:hypothetical protein